jgi:hypothetical protein
MSTKVFVYKYAVVDRDDNIIRWELGYNRIGDLDVAEKQGLLHDDEYHIQDVS